ncbi:MAG: lysophospholipid acyltransferase family protein [Chlamydiales bacterium]
MVFFKVCYGHRIYGKKHFAKGAAIIACNHASFFDPPLIGASLYPQIPFFLARDTLFKKPIFSFFLGRFRALPVKRGKENAAIFRMVLDTVKRGKKVTLFPEGTRTPTGKLLPAQPGIGLMVMRAGCRVIPMYVAGSYDIWNCHAQKPRYRGKIALVIGRSMEFTQLKGDKREVQQQISDRIMEKIAQLEQWYLAGAKGEIP